MKRFATSLVVIIPLMASAQSPWSRLDDFCPDTIHLSEHIAQYADENVIVTAGHTRTTGTSSFHSYIASYDYSGQLIGQKMLYSPGKINMVTFLGNTTGANYPLIKISQNRYLLLGVEKDISINPQHAVYQPFFYFFNDHCDSLHFRKYVDPDISYYPYSAMVDIQKNIVVCGAVSSKNLDSTYIWLAKYDAMANLIWSKKYFGYTLGPEAFRVISNHDSTAYIVTGVTENIATGNNELFVFKSDLNGNIKWHKFLTRPFPAWNNMDVTPTPDGNYAFISTYGIDANDYGSIYFGKLDNDGDTIWTKTFKRYNTTAHRGKQIAVGENGDLILFGYATDKGREQNAIIRVTDNGKIKWYREYLHKDTNLFSQVANNMSYTNNKQIVLSGFFGGTNTPGIFDSTGDFSWLIVSDTFGCMIPGCQEADTMWWPVSIKNIESNKDINISLYPNPTTGSFSFLSDEPGIFRLYSIEGQKIATYNIGKRDNDLHFPASASPGLYTGRFISSSGNSHTLRIIYQP